MMGAAHARAATLVAPGRYEIREYPLPDPAPGCALVGMSLSGICGTDKHTYQGYTTEYAGTGAPKEIPFPIIQGHENVGTVAAIGASGRIPISRASPCAWVTGWSWEPTSSAASAITAGTTFPTTFASAWWITGTT